MTSDKPANVPPQTTPAQNTARAGLGVMLIGAGTSHLTFAREPFKAQVPPWMPLDPDTVVVGSGIAEIALGASLLLLPRLAPRLKPLLGCAAAGFFAAIFPGNLAQYQYHRDAFGLHTDRERFARLFIQPVLVAWALWSSGAITRVPSASEHQEHPRHGGDK